MVDPTALSFLLSPLTRCSATCSVVPAKYKQNNTCECSPEALYNFKLMYGSPEDSFTQLSEPM